MLVKSSLTWAGAVLAGGQSRRMGSPKEGARLTDGTAMLEVGLAVLRECCSTILVQGSCRGFDLSAWPGVLHLFDLRPGLGPLSGIESLLASGVADGYLVLACDQPALTAPLLLRLAGGTAGRFFRTEGSERLCPLPGYFPANWLPAVRSALDRGRLSLRALIESQQAVSVPMGPGEELLLESLNTPQEVELFRRGTA